MGRSSESRILMVQLQVEVVELALRKIWVQKRKRTWRVLVVRPGEMVCVLVKC